MLAGVILAKENSSADNLRDNWKLPTLTMYNT